MIRKYSFHEASFDLRVLSLPMFVCVCVYLCVLCAWMCVCTFVCVHVCVKERGRESRENEEPRACPSYSSPISSIRTRCKAPLVEIHIVLGHSLTLTFRVQFSLKVQILLYDRFHPRVNCLPPEKMHKSHDRELQLSRLPYNPDCFMVSVRCIMPFLLLGEISDPLF